jgi:hypothetical protein
MVWLTAFMGKEWMALTSTCREIRHIPEHHDRLGQ